MTEREARGERRETLPLVLVTGARGYVGGRVVRYLESTGKYRLRLASRVVGAPRPGVEWVSVGDYSDGALFDAAVDGVTHIVHLAAPNEIVSEQEPDRAVDVTVNGTLRLVRAAQRATVARVVYLSTIHVYGAPLIGDIDERTLPRPIHPYAITHRAAEDFVLAAGWRGEMRPVVLRLSNGIGAPVDPEVQRWTLIANDLSRQVATTGRMVLKSSGLQWRDFIPLSDVCRAIEHMMSAPVGKLGDGLFNLGGEGSLRIIDLAERLRERAKAVLGIDAELVRPEPAPGERHPPLTYRIDKLLATGFRFEGTLDDELDATLRLCRDVFGTPGGEDRSRGAA